MKILVGEISSYKAIVIARFIKRNYENAIIYTYDQKKTIKYIHTRYSDHHVHIDKDKLEDELAELIKKEEIEYFFPVKNHNLSLLIKHKDDFGKSLNYLGDLDAYNILNDKNKLSALALKLGLRVPTTFKTIDEAVIPFVVKPSNLSSAIGVKYVFDKNAIPILNHTQNTIIQEYVEGVGVGYSFYCKNGKIIDGYGHKRLAEYPITGGSSTYRTHYENEEMAKVASTIVGELQYTGFAMFEFKLTQDNVIYLIEVNPRIWGSINQGIADYRINYFKEILGPVTKGSSKEHKDRNTYVGPLVYLSLLSYLMKFQFKPIFRFYRNIFINRSDVSLLRDSGGYISTIIRKLL